MVASVQEIVNRCNRLLFNNNTLNIKSGNYWRRYTTQSAPIDSRDPMGDVLVYQTGNMSTKPVTDIRVKNAYEREIVDNRVNLVFGKRFAMQLDKEDSVTTERLQRFYDRNTLGVTAKEIMRNAGACGSSGVMLYQPESDDALDVAILPLKPYEYAIQYDSKGNALYAIRIYTEVVDRYTDAAARVEPNATGSAGTQADQSGEQVRVVCEYWDNDIHVLVKGQQYYSDSETALRNCMVAEVDEKTGKKKDPEYQVDKKTMGDNLFGAVPFVEFRGLEGARPYFYPVISLIDAYNVLFSDAASEFAAFRNAYLILKNWIVEDQTDSTGTVTLTKEQLLKKMRAFFFDENGDAKFLTREIPTAAFTEFEKVFRHNIDRFSQNIDFTDPEVYGTATNLAIATRLKGAENAANDCADQFELSMKRVISICNGIWESAGEQIDPWAIKFEFPYDRPSNIAEEATTVATLTTAGVALIDALRITSFVDNPEEWNERAAEEKKALIGTMTPFDIKPPDGGTDEGGNGKEDDDTVE